ncbi:uncharacterized protein IL334_007077 [Kwoniella shivajii]|uniref:Zn(2)-C6 fungal-type domain-containing protein n=1 Tax=Kwoniella shivajii TaxID=564305 RepID=A0ABZ1D862_9TREE|nr:hypothetical protein IL334_007077 [Kwoniella shivajii]
MDMGNSTGSTSDSHLRSEKIKRSYRACLHCRSRKAKCDLGDIDAPSSPPCTRCKRESRECVFAPSRRGGNNRKRDLKESMDDSDGDVKKDISSHDVNPHIQATNEPIYPQTFPYPYPPGSQIPAASSSSRPSPSYPYHGPNTGSTGSNLSPITNTSTHTPPSARPAFSHHVPPSASRDVPEKSSTSTPSPKRRRLHLNPPLHDSDPSSIVVADMQNESDALQILALASGQVSTKESLVGGRGRRNQETYMHEKSGNAATVGDMLNFKQFFERRQSDEVPILEDYPLIKLGILNGDQALRLVNLYFRCHHHLNPICPSAVLPKCSQDLAYYASKERYTITAFIIIASRVDTAPASREIHNKAWAVMRGWITDVQTLGAPPTIGLVESLLLLSENLPRTPPLASPAELNAAGAREEIHGDENRQAWQLIGLAVRSAYELGLDKIALRLLPDSERTLEIERAKVAWTYCYLFDRHISIRLGKGFWARGAAVCFQGYSSSAQTGPAAGHGNFPFLSEIGDEEDHPQDDYASLIQAYLELTQLMSNAHDVLYPNASRTRSLVMHGEYFKYLDEMARSLDAFKVLWRKKQWKVFPLTDILWTIFYYVQLYICAFSFQAHVERATMRAEKEYRILQQSQQAKDDHTPTARPRLSLFPRGAAQSPDARYIFHMCDAAREILHICVNKLYPGGALPYLPTRYLLWFTYAAIVLLKALYSGAMLRGDHKKTLDLVDELCECLENCSSDSDHPTVRYGRQLQSLRRKLAGLSDAANTRSPTGGSTVPLPPIHRQPRRPEAGNNWDGSDAYASRVSDLGITSGSTHQPSGYSGEMGFPSGAGNVSGEYNRASNWQSSISYEHRNQPVVFPYPNTPGPMPNTPYTPSSIAYMTSLDPSFIAAHEQPLVDVGITQGLNSTGFVPVPEMNFDLTTGFGTVDNWFGFVGSGNDWQDNNNANGGEGNDMAQMAGLDLDDFWMQVGPGEAQGGFPFR